MTYLRLLGELDSWFDAAVAANGPGAVRCARGCSACCHGPFDISGADAELVAAAVDRLDPADRLAVRLRARVQREQYLALEPGWAAPWDVDAIGDETFDAVCEALATTPCPALDTDGACMIHRDRPATCRITGLAMRTHEGAVLENVCPILHTSPRHAAVPPAEFDLAGFEALADENDRGSTEAGWVRTTVAGAVAYAGGSA